MATTFSDWDGLIRSWDPDRLAHHGIRGMKWGVRRYQNEDGTLTAAGKARYGNTDSGRENGGRQKKTSARKMQRDFNNLDKGFANVAGMRFGSHANRVKTAEGLIRYATDRSPRERQKEIKNDPIANSMVEKIRKSSADYDKYTQQMRSIEGLQTRIISKAISSGYSLNSKSVKRHVNDSTIDFVRSKYGVDISMANIVKPVYGTQMKIKKTKKGKKQETNISMYKNGWS